MSIGILSAGIDTLHLSVRGQLKAHMRGVLDEAKARAQDAEEPVSFEFPVTSQAFLVKPFGLRGYTYWLTSPDFELVLGKGERFPAALIQFHSAYLHACGPEMAWDLVDLLLRHDVFSSVPDVVVSRIDLYVDFQGWIPVVEDLHRFVCQGRQRRVFEEVFVTGRRLTGFMFGKGGLAARIYDKTEECRKKGSRWLRDVWQGGDPGLPVWRLEFQFRRLVLSEFHLQGIEEVARSIQDLWAYGTYRWLSLRKATRDGQVGHWPEDPAWGQLRTVKLAPASTGIVRRRIEEASEEMLVRGLMGYATSLAALRQRTDLSETFADAEPLVRGYLAKRDRDFAGEVRRKGARLMNVTAPVADSSGSPPPWRARQLRLDGDPTRSVADRLPA
jgi:hypothetical protein